MNRYKKIIAISVITTIVISSIKPTTVLAIDSDTSDRDSIIGTGSAPFPSVDDLNIINNTAQETALYSQLAKKLNITAADAKYLKQWLSFANDLNAYAKAHPSEDVLKKYKDNRVVPQSLRVKYKMDKQIFPLPDVPMITAINALLTPKNLEANPEKDVFGFGHEYMDISRILKDYDSTTRSKQVEGLTNPNINNNQKNQYASSHSLEKTSAFDVSALDYVKCTKVTYKGKKPDSGKVEKTEKLKAVPIQFAAQADPRNTNPLSTSLNGQSDPNSLRAAFGSNASDLYTKLGLGAFANTLATLANLLSGSSLTNDQVNNPAIPINSTATVVNNAATSQASNIMGANPNGDVMRYGTSLNDTLGKTGAAILSKELVNVPEQAWLSGSLDEMAEKMARIILGERFMDRGFTFDGNTRKDIFGNLASQYVTSKILKLEPTSQLRSLPTSTQSEFQTSVGQIAVSQRLGISPDLTKEDLKTKLGSHFDEYFGTANQQTIDWLLTVSSGTTQKFATGAITQAQYYQTVGTAIITTAFQGMANNTNSLADLFGLSIRFGKEDLYLPFTFAAKPTPLTNNPLTNNPSALNNGLQNINNTNQYLTSATGEIQLLQTYYKPLMADNDWTFFASHYKNPRTADLETEDQVRTWLVDHLNLQSDLISPIQNGTINDTYWQSLGNFLFAKMDVQPFNQLALYHYYQTGDMWTATTTNSQTIAVVDPNTTLQSKLGFKEGDLDQLLANRFAITILPRLAHDNFFASIDPAHNTGYINGYSGSVTYTDTFLTSAFSSLKDQLNELSSLSSQDNAVVKELTAYLGNLKAESWTATQTETQQERLNKIFQSVGDKIISVYPNISVDNQRKIGQKFSELLTGRTFTAYTDASPTITTNENIGLTNTFVSNLFSGLSVPYDAARTVGAGHISMYLLNPEDPKAFTSQLLAAAKTNTAAALTNFYKQNEQIFADAAALYNDSLNTTADKLTGQELFNVLSGNRLPLVRIFGSTTYASASNGASGTIYSSSPENLTNLLAYGQFLQNMGINKPITNAGANFASQLPQTILENNTNLTWAGTASDLVRLNGANLLTAVNAPQATINAFNKVWDSNNPQAAIAFLANGNNWQGINPGEAFARNFGEDFRAMGAQFQSIFTNQANPNILTTSIANNVAALIPDGYGYDALAIARSIQQNDSRGLINNFSQIATAYTGLPISTFAAAIGAPPQAQFNILNQGMTMLGTQLGGSNVSQIGGAIQAIGNYYFSGQKQADFGNLVGGLGSALNIPYANMAAQLVSNPVAFGTSITATYMSYGLSSAGFNVDPNAISMAVFGPTAAQRQQIIANANAAGKDANAIISKYQSDAQMGIAYNMVESKMGLPQGFIKSVVNGTDTERAKSLISGAMQFGGLPPEAQMAANMIMSAFDKKGDFDASKITSAAGGMIDNAISQVTGLPVPANFTSQIADLAQGKITPDQFGQSMGNYGISLAGGMLDKEIGLPSGTTAGVTQFAMQYSTLAQSVDKATAAVNAANAALASASNPQELIDGVKQLNSAQNGLNSANSSMANLQAAGIMMGVNMAFGKEINGLENSIGLPPGTISFLMQAGISSMMGGGAFLTVLGTAAPWFVGGLLLSSLLSGQGLSGIFGGKEQTFVDVVCSPGGYYPYVKRTDKAEQENPQPVYDPNINVNILTDDQIKEQNIDTGAKVEYKAIKDRMKPEDVAKKLSLWVGYPGEFHGEKSTTKPQEYKIGLKASARWKIRQLLGEMMLLCPQFSKGEKSANLAYRPAQIVLYQIPDAEKSMKWELPGDLTNNANYLLPYNSDSKPDTMANDKRFVTKSSKDGTLLGILDYSYTNKCGWGSGTPGSMVANENASPGFYNLGVWTEPADEFRNHIHIGF